MQKIHRVVILQQVPAASRRLRRRLLGLAGRLPRFAPAELPQVVSHRRFPLGRGLRLENPCLDILDLWVLPLQIIRHAGEFSRGKHGPARAVDFRHVHLHVNLNLPGIAVRVGLRHRRLHANIPLRTPIVALQTAGAKPLHHEIVAHFVARGLEQLRGFELLGVIT